MAGLSILIPTLNEARRLPLLLADLARWPHGAQVIVVDGGSRDRTTVVASLAGVARLSSPERGRGQQLIHGMAAAIHDWTLVLHADSRLPPRWCSAVQRVIESPQARRDAWFFDFRVEDRGPMLWLLERSVALRRRLGQRPYGDQGLLIHRTLYAASGGYSPIPLMEDLDLVEKIARHRRLRRLRCPLVTSNRRWQEQGVISRAWCNWRLRQRWHQGIAADQLAGDYDR